MCCRFRGFVGRLRAVVVGRLEWAAAWLRVAVFRLFAFLLVVMVLGWCGVCYVSNLFGRCFLIMLRWRGCVRRRFEVGLVRSTLGWRWRGGNGSGILAFSFRCVRKVFV